ncbi:MAG: hypothetical protein MJ131_03795 [Lachnospiraceae bacterium]|nr:hypothetical protein [Lachnospiraceae bacterium]
MRPMFKVLSIIALVASCVAFGFSLVITFAQPAVIELFVANIKNNDSILYIDSLLMTVPSVIFSLLVLLKVNKGNVSGAYTMSLVKTIFMFCWGLVMSQLFSKLIYSFTAARGAETIAKRSALNGADSMLTSPLLNVSLIIGTVLLGALAVESRNNRLADPGNQQYYNR